MPPTTETADINVSLETFNEIANALEARGIKVNKDAPISITKDIKIKGPVDYRQVLIRKEVLGFVKDIYKTPIIKDFEVSNSEHFINFLDEVYQYILLGKVKPIAETETKPTSKW